jgi:Glycosyl hydrolases family 16
MKARFGLLVVLAVLSTLLVSATTSPAEAAPFGARLSRTPIVGESIKVYGAVPPAKRPVQLLVYRGGRWVGLGSTRTGARGSYAFTVRASASAVKYRVFAAKKKIKKKKLPARYSNVVQVRGVQPSLSLAFVPAPVGIATSGDTPAENLLTPGVVTFRPARPGAAIRIQRLVGNTWTTVLGGSGRQDSAGNFKFKGIAAGSVSDPRTFRAVAAPGAGAPNKISSAVVPAYWAKNFDDNFSDATASNQQWASRPSVSDTNRECMWPYQDMFSVADGVATLAIQKQSATTNPDGVSCPAGFWRTAVVGTANGTPSFTQQNGVFAARIKFHSALGAHGGFWLQGLGPQSTEVDMEYFGDGRPDGGITNFVHVVNGSTITSSGGMQPGYRAILGAGHTPSNGWHVYSVQWGPTGYIFRVDGVVTFSTNKPRVAAVPEELMLSLVTSSYEVPYLTKAHKTTAAMQVDWVRTWQSSP